VPTSRPSEQTIDMADAAREYQQERVDDLEDVIKSTVRAGTWEPDGTVGSIGEYDGLLIVHAPAKSHQELYKLLSTMREALASRPKTSSLESDSPTAFVMP